MYNTNDACKPESGQTVYADHEDIVSQLFDNIDMLEAKLSRVTLANKASDVDKIVPSAAVPKSQLKTWVSDQTSKIKTAIDRIHDLSNRLDID